MANQNGQLDATIEVVTPENIDFSYRVAGPMRRGLAFAIDFGIRMVVLFVLSFVFQIVFGIAQMENIAAALATIAFFILAWFYGGLLETYWNGQTVGKRSMGIRVLSTDGRAINGMQAVMRNILREADSFPVFIWAITLPGFGSGEQTLPFPIPTYILALVVMSATARYQRLGDLACRTMVVMEERSWAAGLVKIDDPLVIRLAGELPAGLEFSRTMREALSAYIERRRFFPPGRRADIARHLGQPLCQRFGLLPDTNHDLLMCALYYRAFIADQGTEDTSELSGIWNAPAGAAPRPVMVGAGVATAAGSMPVIQTDNPYLRTPRR